MRYFQHDCQMIKDPRLVVVMKQGGAEAYALWCFLLERIGSHGDWWALDTRAMQNSLEILAEDVKIPVETIKKLLDSFAEVKLIEKIWWKRHKIIYVPKMQQYADEHTTRRIREDRPDTKPSCIRNIEEKPNGHNKHEHSGVTPELDGSNSGPTPIPPASSSCSSNSGNKLSKTTTTNLPDEMAGLGPEQDLLNWMYEQWRNHPTVRVGKLHWPKVNFPGQFRNQEKEFGVAAYRRAWKEHLDKPEPHPFRFVKEAPLLLGNPATRKWA